MILRLFGHGCVVVLLTLLTQVGGVAWVAALWFKRRVISFILIYATLWMAAFWLAPLAGRVALPCSGGPLKMQSVFYCVTSRHYATPEMRDVALEAAQKMAIRFPGTQTLALDAGFPFLDGFPMLPHLSHDDGEKLDLAFYYTDEDGQYVPGRTKSYLGYWAFETLGTGDCPDDIASLRWEFAWLQPLWRPLFMDAERTRILIHHLVQDARVAKIFVEPALAKRLEISHSKLRFQGCRAARHDDHLHLQL